MSLKKKMPKIAKANVKPVRQRSQFTCMATSMTMCLQALGINTNEDEVNKVMNCRPGQGASWEDAIACAQHFGARATLTSPATLRQIKEWTDRGVPVMFAWNPEGRDWSHASVIYDVDENLNVHIADPNIPDPDETVRIVPKSEFYGKWFEKMPKYLFRRPACAIEREITPDGRQVVASHMTQPLRTRPDYGENRSTEMKMIPLSDMQAALQKQASDDEKNAKFEKGKPADPTKNMSEEQKAEWNAQKEKNKDKFKKKAEEDEAQEEESQEEGTDKEASRSRMSWEIDPDFWFGRAKEARAAAGLYGFTKSTQRDCESAVRKLEKAANKIAKSIYAKDEKVAEFLSTHARRSESASANILIAAMRNIGPKIASSKEGPSHTMTKEGNYGLYGFNEKTARLGLSACTDIKCAAGRIASDLHKRRAHQHDRITGFFQEHGRTAKCAASNMILGFYPEMTVKSASVEVEGQKVAQKVEGGFIHWEE